MIDAGQPSGLPLKIDREDLSVKIGSTLHIMRRQNATIQCEIFNDTGLPPDSVDYAWYYMGRQITNETKFMIMVDQSRRSSTLMANDLERADNGQFTCVAFNPAGHSQATSEVIGECYTHAHTHTHTYTHTHTPDTHTHHALPHLHSCTYPLLTYTLERSLLKVVAPGLLHASASGSHISCCSLCDSVLGCAY